MQGIAEFQRKIEEIYFERDNARGVPGTFMWFVEEVGELGRALRVDDRDNLMEEFADVFAWMATLASIAGIELCEAVDKYAAGCPRCREAPCSCSPKR